MQPDILLQNRYRVIYAVDERPNSQLLRARDEQSGALVLLGVLPLGAGQRENIAMLAKQIAGVKHDLLVPLTDHFADGERYILVSPDPGGQDLDRALRSRGGPLPEQETLSGAVTLLSLFDALHGQKPPLHIGDAWPSDVVVTPENWRMLPFVFARLVTTVPSPYRAPELANPDVEPSNETDTYTLSALLYHALAGSPPTTAQQQQAGTPLVGPRSLNPELSALAEQVLLRALQQKPANRYQNARELRLALETVHLMAGRSLGLGPDILKSPEVIAATARSNPESGTPTPAMPVLQEVPVVPTIAQATPVVPAPEPAPYQPLPAAAPPRRGLSTGCLVGLALGLAALVVALAVALVVALAANGGFASLFGRTSVPNARNAVVPASPQAITLENVATITRTAEITGELFGAVSYAPAGDSLAVGFGNGIRILDGNLDEQREIGGHNGRVFALSYAPDGNLLVSAALDDPDVRVWNPQTGELVRTLRGHTAQVRSVVVSPNNDVIVSSAADNTIRVWNLADGTPITTLTGHKDYVSNVVFSADGKLLASSSRDGTVRLWDMPSGAPRTTFSYAAQTNPAENVPYWTTGLAFAPDGARLAVGSTDGSITIVSVANGAVQQRITGGRGFITLRGLAWSIDGRTLYSAASSGTVKAWDPTSGGELGTFAGNSVSAFAIALRPDGAQLVSVSDVEGTLRVWDTTSRNRIGQVMIGRGLITQLAYAPDAPVLSMTGFNGALSFRNNDGQVALISPAGSARSTVFLRGAKLGIVSDQDQVRLISATDRSNVQLEGLQGTPSTLAVNNAGTRLAAGSATGAVVVWDEQGNIQQQFTSAFPQVDALAISDDGGTIAVGGPQNLSQVEIRDGRGQVQHTLVGPRNGVVTLAFQPGSTRLAALDSVGELFLWDATTGQLLDLFNANEEQAAFTSLAFAPNGSMLIAGTANGEVVAWNPENNQQVASVPVDGDGPIFALAFRPDGEQIAASVRNIQASVYTLELAR